VYDSLNMCDIESKSESRCFDETNQSGVVLSNHSLVGIVCFGRRIKIGLFTGISWRKCH